MLVYQKTMFDRYYCIKSFCHLETLEKRFEKFILYNYNGAQNMKDLKSPVPEQRFTSF